MEDGCNGCGRLNSACRTALAILTREIVFNLGPNWSFYPSADMTHKGLGIVEAFHISLKNMLWNDRFVFLSPILLPFLK